MKLPVTIHRHWIGLVAIAVGFLILAILVLTGVFALFTQGQLDALGFWFGVWLAGLIIVIGGIAAYVYWLSTIVLTDTGITFTSWLTLFYDIQAECTWDKVQDATAKQGGIFAQVLDYGTLLVQTASAEPNLRLKTVPSPTYWQRVILDKIKK